MEKKIGNYLIKVKIDDDPYNPRENDNATVLFCGHKKYNRLGDTDTGYDTDDYGSWDEVRDAIIENENPVMIKPLYLYDHSGITISTSPFSCGWDSGQVGWVYLTQKRMDELGITSKDYDLIIESEVEEYDQYIRGEVYMFEVYEVKECNLGHLHKELIDSCGGYYSKEDAMDEAMGYVPEDAV
jgi:hypothetical protein